MGLCRRFSFEAVTVVGARCLEYAVKVPRGDITLLLQKWSAGDDEAVGELTPLVYVELRRLARKHLRQERAGHSLSSIELVHEAYLRLVDQRRARWQDRAHFFAMSARLMRRILVDHARAHLRAKRGGGTPSFVLNEAIDLAAPHSADIVALDDALESLAKLDPRQSRIVELRFFTGLSIEETAQVLRVSKATVNRDWSTARAWLTRELSRR
jgi:RNA polymerase sigma factor (TIGR02999 family)